jgi:hypothetical protein
MANGSSGPVGPRAHLTGLAAASPNNPTDSVTNLVPPLSSCQLAQTDVRPMNERDDPIPSIMPILLRFSGKSAMIRRLVAEDEGFRCLAEDYLLAHNTLRRLENQPSGNTDRIAEYKAILRDLEDDIDKFLTCSHAPPR